VGGTASGLEGIPWIAADLQEFYRVWLLPFEEHLLQQNRSVVATLQVPAGLLRKLAIERTQDSLLRAVVKQLATRASSYAAQLQDSGNSRRAGVLTSATYCVRRDQQNGKPLLSFPQSQFHNLTIHACEGC
jgi:phosphoribosylcarboxyaminoimidazole (NCAIR) mutase